MVIESTSSDWWFQRKNLFWKICTKSQNITKKVSKIGLPNQTSKIWHILGDSKINDSIIWLQLYLLILLRTLRYCPILLRILRYCQVLHNSVQYWPILSSGTHWGNYGHGLCPFWGPVTNFLVKSHISIRLKLEYIWQQWNSIQYIGRVALCASKTDNKIKLL